TGLIPVVADLTGPPEELRRSFFHAVTTSPTWEDMALPSEALWEALRQGEPFDVAEGVRCYYRRYARRQGKARWGGKSPPHRLHRRPVRRLLPGARSLPLVREGGAVALSLRGLWFSRGDSAEALARHGREWIEPTRAQAGGCRHYLEVRYEDLVRDPR